VHRVSARRHKLGVDLGNRRQLAKSLGLVEERMLIFAHGNPQGSQTAQDNSAFRIGYDCDRALAFGRFAPRINPQHVPAPGWQVL
jgi:hypothetical protein